MARLLVAAAVVASQAACAIGDGDGPRVGYGAPAYAATTLAGDTVSLASLRGRVVLLNLWATWCGPCRRETPYLQALYEERRGEGLEIVGVSMDTPAARDLIDRFVEEYGVTYTILHDPQMRAMDLYRAIGLPGSFLVDREGTLRWMKFGAIAETDGDFQDALDSALR
jgi:peroxiredoxin